MNRQAVLRAALLICMAILVAGVVLGIKTTFGFIGYSYANAGKYSCGDTEIKKNVSNLDIDWLNGKVNILYHGGNTVEVSEKSDRDVSENLRMRWQLDGETLRIRYAKPGRLPNRLPEKELTVLLPEDIVLRDASVSATSGSLNIPTLCVDNLVLNVTSGDITASAKAKTVSADATSGHIDLQVTDSAKEITAVTTSGSISAQAGNADRFTAETTSGSVHVTLKSIGEVDLSSTSGNIISEILKAKRAEIESTSGDIQLSVSKLGSLKVKTTSGRVSATLPAKPGFTAEFKTTSGQIDYDLPLMKQNGSYVCGDGSGEVEIHTTSGNIIVNEGK